MNYTFLSPSQVVFGWGRRSELPRLAASFGRRVFFVSGSRTLERLGVIPSLIEAIESAGLTVIQFAAPNREPEVADVDALTREWLAHQPTDGDVAIAIGGGSTIDLAKAAAAMATNVSSFPSPLEGEGGRRPDEGEVTDAELVSPKRERGMHATPSTSNASLARASGSLKNRASDIPLTPGPSPARGEGRKTASVLDFLEGVGKGLQIERPPLPLIAVPTTAGTGTEATKNAVISSYDPPFKKSLRSDRMVPRCVVIDPELTVSLPATTTAYTGMDAITQLIESYVSRRAAPIPRALCEHGLELALLAIRQAVSDGGDRPAREAMSHAAFLSGLALANSGLGLAHGVAAALGVHCRVPHGLACAVMLPAALRFNLSVREADIARLARRTTTISDRNDAAAAESFVEEIESLCRDVQIPPRLRDLGVRQDQIPQLVPASHGNSLSGNPRDVTDAELSDLLESLW